MNALPLMALALFVSAGCSESQTKGGSGERCQPDSTCDNGLACVADVCGAPIDAGILDPDAAVRGGALQQILGAPIQQLDLLVVVDNSSSMRMHQESLARDFSDLLFSLEETLLELPDLHIAVTSTDLGAGGALNLPGCEGEGDNGAFLVPSDGSCTVPAPERFIIDVAAEGSEGRTRNFDGELYEAFSCLAQPGTSGCGFEQPLEAMKRALNGTHDLNAGFLREDAMLAVLVVSDEDDCSTYDPSLFNSNAAEDNLESELGPFGSFRCFEFGVVCSPDEPRVTGAKHSCIPRENSSYLYDVSQYAEFLKGLKAGRNKLFFSAITGVGDVAVELEEGDPKLTSPCGSSLPRVAPAVRTMGLGVSLRMPPAQTICSGGFSLRRLGYDLADMMSGRCLLATANPDSCLIADVENFGEPEERIVQALPRCFESSTGPCAAVISDSLNCPKNFRVSGAEAIVDRRGTEPPPNTVAVAMCPEAAPWPPP